MVSRVNRRLRRISQLAVVSLKPCDSNAPAFHSGPSIFCPPVQALCHQRRAFQKDLAAHVPYQINVFFCFGYLPCEIVQVNPV